MAPKKSKIVNRCDFKTKAGNENVHSVAFNELTSGEVLALIHALMIARTVSPVADDLSCYLRNSLERVENNMLVSGGIFNAAREFLAELNGDVGLALIRRDELELMRAELKELTKYIRVDDLESMRKGLRETLKE